GAKPIDLTIVQPIWYNLILPPFKLSILFGLSSRIPFVFEVGLDYLPNWNWHTAKNLRGKILNAKTRSLEQLRNWNAADRRPDSGRSGLLQKTHFLLEASIAVLAH